MIQHHHHTHRYRGFAELVPDLTPMLDVMFILLVFFILTANTVPYAITVDVPEDSQQQAHAVTEDTHVKALILADSWGLDDERYPSFERFSAALLQQKHTSPEMTLAIIGQKDAPLEKLVQLFGWLQQHNIQAADILVEQAGD